MQRYHRGERRSQAARLRVKRFHQELRFSYGNSEAEKADEIKWAWWRARKRVNTNTLCSCSLCCTPRKAYGNAVQSLTRQERIACLTLREETA